MNAVLKPQAGYVDTNSAWNDLADSLERLRSPAAELQALAERCRAKPPLIIVGAGPAAQECARHMSEMITDDWILVINGEDFFPYHRAQLSSVLASGNELAALLAHQFAPQVHFVHGVKVTALHRQQKQISTDTGVQLNYRQLILATGSRSRRPTLSGLTGSRVFDFRQLSDLEQIAALAPQRVAVLGGGLLGIEAARALKKFSDEVTVFEYLPHLLPRQMDLGAGERLANHLLASGIQVQVNARLITAESSDTQVLLLDENHTTRDFDAVVCATGISANIELATQAELHCNNGVVVDDNQRSSDPDIYAIGECSERRGQTAGNLSTSLDHARRAACTIFDRTISSPGFVEVFQLKIGSCVAVAIGNARPTDSTAIMFVPNDRGYYRVIVEQQRVVGAILVGDAGLDFSPFTAAVESRLAWSDEIETGFLQTGLLPRVDSLSNDTVTCFCAGVTFGQLCQLRDAGHSHDSIVVQTGASTHCGSCAQRVAHITAGAGKASPITPKPKALWTTILLSALLIVAACIALVIPMADSWQSSWRAVDMLWRNNLARQISGYVLLSLIALTFLPAWQRRNQREHKRRQTMSLLSWHMISGCAVITGFVAHTGARLGHGLNNNLSLIFVITILLGAASSVAWRRAAYGTYQRATAQSVRALHWAILFPLPALLIFHIVKAYYF